MSCHVSIYQAFALYDTEIDWIKLEMFQHSKEAQGINNWRSNAKICVVVPLNGWDRSTGVSVFGTFLLFR